MPDLGGERCMQGHHQHVVRHKDETAQKEVSGFHLATPAGVGKRAEREELVVAVCVIGAWAGFSEGKCGN